MAGENSLPSPMELLPTDVLISILCKLPVGSIISCRCVCSTLRNIITSNSIFAQLHYKTSEPQVLLRVYGDCDSSKPLQLVEIDHQDSPELDELVTISKFRLPMQGLVQGLVVLNSCNGFVCLGKTPTFDPVVIYNPVTGEYINLPVTKDGLGHKIGSEEVVPTYDIHNIAPVMTFNPKTGEYIKLPRTYDEVVSGFGFSSESNQLKVVRILYRNGKRMAEIYRLGEISWTNIGYAPDNLPQRCHCSYASTGHKGVWTNGVFHWIADSHSDLDYIITFDFENEKFGTLKLPPCFPPTKSFNSWYTRESMTLGVLAGCLYVIYHDYDSYSFDGSIDLWVMEDYGVEESWTKFCVIGSSEALKFMKHRRILINCASTIFYNCGDCRLENRLESYDPKSWDTKIIEHPGIPRWFRSIAHVPSFCSFKDIMKPTDEFPIQINKC